MPIDDNNKKHYIRINGYTNQIQAIFDKYNKEFAKLGLSVDYDKENGLFYFRDFPEINNKADKLFKEFANEINTVIANGVSNEWNEANLNNNQIVQSMLGNAWQNAQYSKYFNNHIPAKEAFLKRKTNGLNLSQKVWKYAEVYKENIEDCLSVGIEQGTSAAKLSREIRQYLNEPNKLFRRVRDEFGELRLSKNAKAYNPGAGVYRSSYKNAMRLTRTEINMAYRHADYERWQDMDFVIGIEIQLSGSHPKYDICDTLQGKYPKTFKFGGWHPQCLCFATPILMTDEQFLNEDNADEITDLPQNFKDWYEYHKDDITKAKERGKLPYFLKDNESVILSLSKNSSLENIQQNMIDEFKKLGVTLKGSEITIEDGYVSLTKDQYEILARHFNDNLISENEHKLVYDKEYGYVSSQNFWQINGCCRNNGYNGEELHLNLDNIDSVSSRKFGKLREKDIETIKTLDNIIERNSLDFPIKTLRMATLGEIKSKFNIPTYDFEELVNEERLKLIKSGKDAVISSIEKKLESEGYKKYTEYDVINKIKETSTNGYICKDAGYLSSSTVFSENEMGFRKYKIEIEIPAGTPIYITDNIKESECILGRHTKLEYKGYELSSIDNKYTLKFRVKK